MDINSTQSKADTFFQWIKTNSALLLNAGSLIGTSGITSALGFVYWWLAARSFSPQAVGLASAVISAMTLLGAFSILGLSTLLLGELQRRRAQATSLISTALLLVGAVGAVVGVMYAILAPYLSKDFRALGGNIEHIALFALGVSLTAITLVFDEALIGLLLGGLQLWRNTLFASVKLVVLFAFSLLLSHVTGMTIYASWIIGSLFSLLVLGIFILLKWRGPLGRYRPQWGLLRQLGPEALKHHMLNLTLQAPSLILPVLVTVMLSVTENAWFYVAWNLTSVANVISVSLTMTLYAVSAAQPATLARKMRLTLGLALVACLTIDCLLLFDTRQVLTLFGHNYYVQAAFSLRILAIESLPFIIKNHYIALSRIRNQITRTVFVTIVTGSLELGCSALGAHLGGLNGLSLGWFSAMCIESVFMAPAVYQAARFVKVSNLATAKQSSVAEEAIYVVDTLVLATIRSTPTMYREHLLQTSLKPGAHSVPTKPRLRPVRLQHLPAYEEKLVEDFLKERRFGHWIEGVR